MTRVAALVAIFALQACRLAGAEPLPERPQVLKATVEVLEELADEGVVDALYQLADLASRPDTQAYFEEGAGFRYLALSAASGRASAVRWLAYRLALETEARAEAAVLLSAAAVMGDSQAVLDLRLWPLLGPVDEAQMLAAFAEALDRLSAGRLIDCQRLPFDCPDNIREATALDASAVLLASAWKNQAPAADTGSLVARFGRMADAYVAFPDARYQRFLDEERHQNRPLRERLADASAQSPGALDWEAGAYRDRQRMRDESASAYIDNSRSSSVRRYLDGLEERLEAINRHRSSARAIELDAIEAEARSDKP